MDEEYKTKVKKLVKIIAKSIGIGFNDLCLCGSGKKYKKCCSIATLDQLLLLENIIKKTEAYQLSQGKIQSIPRIIWNKFEEISSKRLKCLYIGCDRATINCHLVPENILRSNYGGHCKEYQQDAMGNWEFGKIGIGDAGAIHVFCKDHDNNLFQSIDTLDVDFSCKEKLFLFGLKVIAFCLRKIQYLLFINYQIKVFTPYLLSRGKIIGSHEINTIDLKNEYLLFQIVYNFFKKSIQAYQKENWGYFSYFHRSIPYQNPIFFGSFFNPSHDLNGLRMNSPQKPIALACNIFTKTNNLHVILSCPDKESQIAYEKLLKQLEKLDNNSLITVINNFLTLSTEKPLMPETFLITPTDLQKIPMAHQLAKDCLVSSSEKIFDLKNSEQAIKFI